MNRIFLLSTLAAGLALTLSACDEQQATDSNSVPLQQQGAAPVDSTGSADPLQQPAAEESQVQPAGAAESETMEPLPDQPAATQPENTQ